MKYEYLLFNLFVIASPLISLLIYKKAKKPDKKFILAIIIPSLFFIITDILVTGFFWTFNHKYITQIKLFTIPIEEALFFITVPFACLFLWKNIQTIKIKNKTLIKNKILYLLSIILTLTGIIFLTAKIYYTGAILITLTVTIILDILLKTNIYSKKKSLIFITIILALTFIFNLYLTARPIVNYNPNLKTNINIITIPIEDFLYGISLIATVLIIYKKQTISSKILQKKKIVQKKYN